jgi:hypothetical protein
MKVTNNNELLRKMDNLLLLLTEHTTHENCCVKDIIKLIGDNDK